MLMRGFRARNTRAPHLARVVSLGRPTARHTGVVLLIAHSRRGLRAARGRQPPPASLRILLTCLPSLSLSPQADPPPSFPHMRPSRRLLTLAVAAAVASSTHAQWVVETNSLRIVEPASAAGRHDAAIGDVSWERRGGGLERHTEQGLCGRWRARGRAQTQAKPPFFRKTGGGAREATPTNPPSHPPPSHTQFGVPLYGATLSGEVQYVGGDAEGCTPFSERVRPGTPGFPVVLLVDRGDCYFIEKAYNAEKAGAQVRGSGRRREWMETGG